MTIAAKHFDPIVGVDVHIILIPTPAGPVPTPLPNPFVGMVLDPFDYVPFVGATVKINGMPRGQAGTGGIAVVPHLPLGGPFGPPPPGNEAEIFMGSATVATDGDAQSRLALPALSCQSIGMPAPFRPKGQPAKSMMLPTSVVLSIPMGPPVLIGGPPTISLMALGMKAGFALLGKLGGMLRKAQRGAGRFGDMMRAITRKANAAGDKLADLLKLGPKGRQRISNAICTVTGHPVDVATGRVFTEKVDLQIPGVLPFVWKRSWSSTSTHAGELGHGWHHSYQHALYVRDDVVLYRNDEGRLISFPPLREGQEYFDRNERLTLRRDLGGYALRTVDRKTYRFRDVGRAHDEHVLSAIHADAGGSIQLHYDDRGWLAEIVDSGGRSLQLGHDRQGRITTLTAPHPDRDGERFVVVQYSYDDRGNLVQVIDALGQPASYAYDRHLLVKETDRNGLSFHFQYDGKDANARCTRTWGDGGIYDHKLKYDVEAGVTWVENSLGHVTRYRHEGGLVVEVVDALGGVTKTEYAWNQKLKETDPVGGVRAWKYDERGNTVELIAPDGAKMVLRYNERDQAIEATDAIGGRWRWDYDEQGRLIKRANPLDAGSEFRYQGSRLAAVIDPLRHVTSLVYDDAGLLRGVVAPDGGSTGWEYDRMGRAVRVVDPNGNVQQRRFDLLGRTVGIDEPDGNVRELLFDGEGNVVRAADAQHDVRFGYRGMGRLAFRSEAGTTVRFEYDSEEQLTGIVNEHGHVYRFALGKTGSVDVESGFDGVRRVYERDLAGRVQRVRRASGIESVYTYDKAGRVAAVEHVRPIAKVAGESPTAVPADQPLERLGSERYAYRKDGELLEAGNDAISVRFERDAIGRIIKENQGKHWVQSEYDPVGLRARMQSSLGANLAIDRNAMGDATGVSAGSFTARFERDLLGLELERELPGGVRSRWRRDKLGRPVQHDLLAEGELLRARSYHWEKNDRLRMVVDALQGPTAYTHDAFGNLAAATYPDGSVELRMPDAVGNLFKRDDRKDRVYGPAGQLLESTDERGRVTRYSYDAEGNLIEKREGNGRVWRYRWGSDGMLREVLRPDETLVRFEYDALGRRIAKHYRGQTTRWVWDGNVPLHEWVEGELEQAPRAPATPMWLADATVKQREAELTEHLTRGPPDRGTLEQPITWLFEPESFSPLAKLSATGTHSIVCDHLGTPIAMVDDRGALVWSADISAYGELRALEGKKLACPFRWPGQYEDAETGLYYNRFRYYDPESGQYVSQDPIKDIAGLRTDTYVLATRFRHTNLGDLYSGTSLFRYPGDPTTWLDPFGRVRIHTERGVEINAYPGPPAGGIEHLPLHAHVEEAGQKETRVLMEDYYKKGKLVASRGDVYPGDPPLSKKARKVVNSNLDDLSAKTHSVFHTGKC